MKDNNEEEQWMRRALRLAAFGMGAVSPNPMVGCVLVCDGKIIGEGWHRQYGSWHAEVNAVNDAVERGNEALLKEATAYVTLEPCAHTGNTPPCADLMIARKIKKVVICNEDPNPKVDGRGIERMLAAGIEVETGLCKEEGRWLNRRFFAFMEKKRPYIILKWAETSDGFIGTADRGPLKISGLWSDILVHKWRSEEDGIMVGTNTAVKDNPRLNVRLWPGKNPVRIILDRQLKLSVQANLYDGSQPTLIYNYLKESELEKIPVRYESSVSGVVFRKLIHGEDEIQQLFIDLHRLKVQSVIVEGGALLASFLLKNGIWDEIRRCQSNVPAHDGVKAPLAEGIVYNTFKKGNDLWTFYRNPS